VKALGPQPAIYPLDLAGADPADYEQMADASTPTSAAARHPALRRRIHRPAPAREPRRRKTSCASCTST
jgi:hypothetical protein